MTHPAFRDKGSKLYLPYGTGSVNPGLSRTFRDGWQLCDPSLFSREIFVAIDLI